MTDVGSAPPTVTEPPVAPVRVAPAGRALDAVDGAGEVLFERLRGRRGPDTVAAVLSNLADYGVIWVVLAAAKARRPGAGRRRAVTTLALAGVASFTVNRTIKQLVRRGRPEALAQQEVQDTLPVRRPTSTSFPSGHTLAAFTTAVSLPDTGAGQATALAFAAAVAASRVHLRAHHASDVAAGAAIGTVLGVAVRATTGRSRRRAR